ncbi:MAG: hypothetical protein JNK04_03955 [Myxococcales bacterium]|nr:hypothetical protein [Myxococcales bacterium]
MMSADPRNAIVTAALFGSFAALLTVHVAAVFGIAKKKAWARAAGAFVLPPLAPIFAFTRGMRARAVLWCFFACLYAVALSMARSAW